MKSLVIGIAGASGSGKSTFCDILLNNLSGYKVVTFRTDNYFKSNLPKMKSPISQNEYDDYNHPESVDYEKIKADLNNIIETDYDIIIIEGIMIFYFEDIRKLLDLKIFIDLDSDERMYRRIKRNTAMWGLKLEEVADYYLEAARHREREYIIWTKMFADIIINGNNFETTPLELVISWIKTRVI